MKKNKEPLSPEVLQACARQATDMCPAPLALVMSLDLMMAEYGLKAFWAAIRQLKCRRSLERARRARVN